jgi:hypothetical protein
MADQILGLPPLTQVARQAVATPASPTFTGPNRDLAQILPGAIPKLPNPATFVNMQTMSGGITTASRPPNDMRVVIKVPTDYLTSLTGGSRSSEFSTLGGIVFPYSPTVSLEHKADYTSQTPTHSNYAINFYKSSSVGDIAISGLFTVQSDKDAEVYLSAVNLLRALTKMRFSTDPDAGSPPPVCRLNAYGTYMLSDVPVAITSFKNDMPNDVDFYELMPGNGNAFGHHLVPTKSTIAVNCKIMYSRQEMLNASVTGWLSGNGLGV